MGEVRWLGLPAFKRAMFFSKKRSRPAEVLAMMQAEATGWLLAEALIVAVFAMEDGNREVAVKNCKAARKWYVRNGPWT